MTAVPTLSARVLLEVEHGSHLYGLSHPGSDRDRYIVLADRPAGARGKYRWATHRVHGADDVFTCDLHTFIDMAYNGVPQALEAMFAPAFETDEIAALRAGFRAGGGTVIGTYRRTIRNFAVGDFKRQRHALRLALNLAELMRTGRFSPR
ncbi:MAG: nucleotidyltransferase domain-containing protein, partial [Actinomycetota bacterium]|nr:nucleotidyltransferase domain-containing protein [Actinomycetota bacterium]